MTSLEERGKRRIETLLGVLGGGCVGLVTAALTVQPWSFWPTMFISLLMVLGVNFIAIMHSGKTS